VQRRTLRTLFILCAAAIAAVAAGTAIAAVVVPPNLSRTLEAQRRLAAERPNDPTVFNDLGNLLVLTERPAEAEEAYRRAVELGPERVSALFNLALLLQQRGELDEAAKLLRRVNRLDPDHAWAHYQLGAIHEQWGHPSRAVDFYARAFSLDPQLAFEEVNPHIVINTLVTKAMLKAYKSGYALPYAPKVYEDPGRIAAMLVPIPRLDADQPDQVTGAPELEGDRPGRGTTPGAPGDIQAGRQPSVLRPGDLPSGSAGQATPQGPGYPRPQGGVPTTPRGLRQWNRPEPIQPAQPAPGTRPGEVVTPPPGGVYYRPGLPSTGRLDLNVGDEGEDPAVTR
jgi:hypothetical protein